tara:strand:+ start:253 stop:1059 length:807 start_codon:yes stop_codon:yes gene_type:complete
MKKSIKYIYSVLGIFLISFNIKALTLEGEYVQGGIVLGKLDEKAIVYLDNNLIPVDQNGYFIFGFKRKHDSHSVLKFVYEKGNTLDKKINVAKRKYIVQKINRLNKDKVTPPNKFYERIKEESKLIKNAKNFQVIEAYYKKGFIKPTEGIVTGVYGSQRILNGKPKRPHYGLDIANKRGTEIISTSDGLVVLAEKDLYFSGGTIIIAHGQGLTTSYLHLSLITVKVGDLIKQGEKIGEIGSTGRTTGPHLHWGMEIRGIRVDPQLLIN